MPLVGHLEHLECGMQPRFRDGCLRRPSATGGKRYGGPEGKRHGRMPVGGIGLGGPRAAIDPEEQAPTTPRMCGSGFSGVCVCSGVC